jgi:hypothetical protein
VYTAELFVMGGLDGGEATSYPPEASNPPIWEGTMLSERLRLAVARQAQLPPPDRPHLIFFAEEGGEPLLELLAEPGVLDALAAGAFGVAVALPRLDEPQAEAVRRLNERGVPAVAWLMLPPEDGETLNLQNYPRALERYQAFRGWARAAGLRFEAVGLDIEPPPDDLERGGWHALRAIAGRLWLARDNALFPSARAAYIELVALIQQDGYEVHTYQLPLIADDRRAGTTIVQRALDIVDLPSDLDVLVCSSEVPIDALGFELGGALVESYGPAADALAVGAGSGGSDAPLPWGTLRRDLLLAARYVDTIYIATLETVVAGGLLERIAALEWDGPARAAVVRRGLVGLVRAALFGALLLGRHGRTVLAWCGWLLALVLWIRRTDRRKPR